MEPIRLQVSITLDETALRTLVQFVQQKWSIPTQEEQKREARLKASQQALFAGKKPPEDRGLLIDSREAAKILKVSTRTLWRMQNDGEMPAPIRIGRAVRWSYEELKAWIDAGCPPQPKRK